MPERLAAAAARGSHPREFVRLGSILLFVAESRETGAALWRTDGTREGTPLVKDIDPASYYDGPAGLMTYGGAVYFGVDDGIHGPELWRTDGTEAGTVLVKDIFQGPQGSLLQTRLYVFRGSLFFKANDGVHGLELWKSDGTEAGTVLVKDTDPATTSWGGLNGNDIVLTEAGGALFFTSFDFVHGSELWKTD